MERTTKNFRKRNAILSCLRQTTVHPSAEWIYHQLKPDYPDLSLGTVYRNLTLFREQGLILSLGTLGGVERFDGNTAPHVHFMCRRCGAVVDLMDIRIPADLNTQAAQATGGSVTAFSLMFEGDCQDCLAKEKSENQETIQ